jgi:hypothetical protein
MESHVEEDKIVREDASSSSSPPASLDPDIVSRASSEMSEVYVSDSSDFGEDTESDRSTSSMELGRNKLEEMSLSYLTSRPEYEWKQQQAT